MSPRTTQLRVALVPPGMSGMAMVVSCSTAVGARLTPGGRVISAEPPVRVKPGAARLVTCSWTSKNSFRNFARPGITMYTSVGWPSTIWLVMTMS